MMKKEKWIIAAAAGVGAAGILYTVFNKRDIPKRATPVQPFDLNRYLGLWHEVARLPNMLEKDIKSLTEEYTLRDDGLFGVITKGYNPKKDKWTTFRGKGKSAGYEGVGMLKVSYLGPFYVNYNVLDLDDDYRYALVSGSGLDYLWILSREQTIPDDIKTRFLTVANQIGFDTTKLEWDIV